MKRPARPEELALWARVAETVKPLPGRAIPKVAAAKTPEPEAGALPPKLTGRAAMAQAVKAAPPKVAPQPLEPNRARRVVRERDPIGSRIDLHGLTLDRAKPALENFIFGAVERGDRVVLVITGKGTMGEGMIRRLTPEWLSAPPLRALVAGMQPADRRHGGDGAMYVALKRGR